MDMRMIQKFGGTSVQDALRLRRAGELAAKAVGDGWQTAVVVSAQGDTTDILLEKAETLTACPSLREKDQLLSAGEQISAALLAMELCRRGIPAQSLTGWQAGIHTTGTFGDADITHIDPEMILSLWNRGIVPVVAGFQGIEDGGSVTTLGRGGSDTTAAALAAALNADLCRIYTDVDGVYEDDPRLHANAARFTSIGYGQMLALAENGAQVLHPKCVRIAMEHGIPLEVCSTFTDTAGTRVGFL